MGVKLYLLVGKIHIDNCNMCTQFETTQRIEVLCGAEVIAVLVPVHLRIRVHSNTRCGAAHQMIRGAVLMYLAGYSQ